MTIIQRVAVSSMIALALLLTALPNASAVGPGQRCGGFPGLQCDAGLFYQKRAGTCAVIDMAGRCVRVPQVCPRYYRPVCGCDNKTYGNDCERQMAMVSKAHNGKCKE